MLELKPGNIRNVALISHFDAGKTMLAEGLLYSAKETKRFGKVDDGTSISDYNQDEIERKTSISTTLLHCNWHNHKINILDTPGFLDFNSEVICSLRAVESVILVIHSISGIEVGTELVWNYAKKNNLPALIVINQLDKEHSDFNNAIKKAKDRLDKKIIEFEIPVNEGLQFDSVIDLLSMKLVKYKKDNSGEFTTSDIPENLKEKAEELRLKLVEAAAEVDDELLETYFDKGELSKEEILKGIKKGILSRNIFPAFCTSAINNMGPRRLLDIIVNFLPSPSDFVEVKGLNPETGIEEKRKISPDEPSSALVFKTISEQHIGELLFFKTFSGSIKTGMDAYNSTKKITERIGQIYSMNGKDRKEIGYIGAGDIGAVVKLKDTHTGDTLCDKKAPIVFESIDFPKPVIRIAIEPKTKGDEEKISNGLSMLHKEDPSFIVSFDPELKQTIIAGQGESHLDIIVKRLKQKFGVDVNFAEPKIPYRETIKSVSEVQGKYKKQTGGRGQYGDVWIKIEPKGRGEGFEFVDAIVGGVIPNKYIPAVEKGLKEAMAEGVIANYPVVDVKVTLYDGSYHSVDSSEMAFKIAASMAFKKGFKQANPVLLEPIYDVEVIVPEEYMGDVMGDISSRRGKILGMESEEPFQIIKAKVPLAELYKYSTTLRSITSGRGMHRRKFSHYEEVPKEIADKIIQEANKKD
ncbi:elongation factor G [candidate division KSB1 bacterium]|nr:MAG: elongation factor G [candidate division KSB1 bacterium]